MYIYQHIYGVCKHFHNIFMIFRWMAVKTTKEKISKIENDNQIMKKKILLLRKAGIEGLKDY